MSEKAQLQRIVRLVGQLESAVDALCSDENDFVVADRMHEDLGKESLYEFIERSLFRLKSEASNRVAELYS